MEDIRRLLQGHPLRVVTDIPGGNWAIETAVFLDGSLSQRFISLSAEAGQDIVNLPADYEKEWYAAFLCHSQQVVALFRRRFRHIRMVLNAASYVLSVIKISPYFLLVTQVVNMWGQLGNSWQKIGYVFLHFAILFALAVLLSRVARGILSKYFRKLFV